MLITIAWERALRTEAVLAGVKLWRFAALAALGFGLCMGSGAPAAGTPEVRVLSSLETVRERDTPGGAREAKLGAARGEWEQSELAAVSRAPIPH